MTSPTWRASRSLMHLKWALLAAALRGSWQQRVQVLLAIGLSVVFGVLSFLVFAVLLARSDDAAQIVTVVLAASVVGVGLLSAAAGVEATIDPRLLAAEPLTRRELAVGMLAAALVGPPSILGLCTGVAIFVGWRQPGVAAAVIVALAVVAWWSTLLLFSRTLANALGAMATGRFRQIAQTGATLAALGGWLLVQLVMRDLSSWDSARWERLAAVASWTPPGQIGRAIATASTPGTAAVHLLVGVAWLPVLLWATILSNERLVLTSPRPGGGATRRGRAAAPLRGGWLSALPATPAGAFGARTIRTKIRTPRQSVNTVTALVVGAGVFFLGPLFGDGTPDQRVVLTGGMLFFAILFDGNNAFGMDGPALWSEVAAGLTGRDLVTGKVISSLVVMGVPCVLVPLGLAALSGGWVWLPAAWSIGVAALLSASGVSVASATLAPVALPDSPNPMAAGDTGQGCVAGLMLMAGTTVLMVVSAPFAVAIFLASSSSVVVTTAIAATAPFAGALILWASMRLAEWRIGDQTAELVSKVTLAR